MSALQVRLPSLYVGQGIHTGLRAFMVNVLSIEPSSGTSGRFFCFSLCVRETVM